MAIIKPSDLPANATPVTTDVLVTEGATVRKSTIAQVMTAGRPFATQAEAEAGSGTTQTMNPLTTKQAIASEVDVTVQAYSSNLNEYAAVNPTAAGLALLDDATAADQRATLELGTAAVANLIDEDDMVSNSAVALPSQQSVKAYVDGASANVILDEDNFASDSAVLAPSQQSVKVFVKAIFVANRTALKALSTTVHTVAHLMEDVPAIAGRYGLFVFSASDLSTEVTADTEEGIYIAPASDATGASGAWVRQFHGDWHISWFGAKFDGATDDVAAYEGVMSLAPADERTRVQLPHGVSRIASNLHHSKPVLFIGQGRGEVSTASNGSATPGTTIRWNGAANGEMVFMCANNRADVSAGATTAELLQGAGWIDVAFNGQANATDTFAARAIWAASYKEMELRIHVRNFTGSAVLCDGGNGILSIRGLFDINVVWGTNALCYGGGGLSFRRFNSFPSTQNIIKRVWGLIYDGTGVLLGDTDNNGVEWCHVTRQSGGAGFALYLANGVTSPARMNVIDYLNGHIKVESDTYGNIIHAWNSEASSLDLAAAAQLHYTIIDYVNSRRYSTYPYKKEAVIPVSSLAMRPDGSVATSQTTASGVWAGIRFTDASTGTSHFNIPYLPDCDTGELYGIRYKFNMETGNTTKNIVIQCRIETATVGTSIATADLNETHTVAVTDATNTLNVVEKTFASPLTFTRDDVILGRLDRLGADAADDASGNMVLFGIDLLYRTLRPANGASDFAVPVRGI